MLGNCEKHDQGNMRNPCLLGLGCWERERFGIGNMNMLVNEEALGSSSGITFQSSNLISHSIEEGQKLCTKT